MSEVTLPPGWELHDATGFLGLVGPVVQRWEGEQLVLGFQASEKHRNRRDAVQGGMLMTLADRAMGATLRARLNQAPVATIQLDVHFVSAARLDEFIEARAQVMRETRSVAFIESRLTAGDRLIATAKGIWKRLGA